MLSIPNAMYQNITCGWNRWNNSIQYVTGKAASAISSLLPNRFKKIANEDLQRQSHLLIHSLAITVLCQIALLPFLSSPITWGIVGACSLATSTPFLRNAMHHIKQLAAAIPKQERLLTSISSIALSSISACGLYFLGISIPFNMMIILGGNLAFQSSSIYSNMCKINEDIANQKRMILEKQSITTLQSYIEYFDAFIERHPLLALEWKKICSTSDLFMLEEPLEDIEEFDPLSQLILTHAHLEHRLSRRMIDIRYSKAWPIFQQCVALEAQRAQPQRLLLEAI